MVMSVPTAFLQDKFLDLEDYTGFTDLPFNNTVKGKIYDAMEKAYQPVVLAGEKIIGAVLTITKIYDWRVETTDILNIHLLNNPFKAPGTKMGQNDYSISYSWGDTDWTSGVYKSSYDAWNGTPLIGSWVTRMAGQPEP